MSDISEVTGLPLLPEGLFWRVRPGHATGRWGTRGFIVEIIHQWVMVTTTQRRFLKIFKRKSLRFENHHEDVVAGRFVYTTVFVPATDKLAKGEEVLQVAQRRDVTLDELTPELILETAEKVMDVYRAQLKAEKLLGDYPPLKLTKEVTE